MAMYKLKIINKRALTYLEKHEPDIANACKENTPFNEISAIMAEDSLETAGFESQHDFYFTK